MAALKLAVIVVILVVQNVSSQVGIGPEIPRLALLRIQLATSQRQISISLKTAKGVIQDNIAASVKLVDSKIAELPNTNSALPAQPISSDPIKTCDQALELRRIRIRAILLNNLHSVLNAGLAQCPPEIQTVDSTCIDDLCNNVTNQLGNALLGINRDLDRIVGDAKKCIADKQDGILQQIEAASEDSETS